MALKASQLKVGDTHSERVVENLSRTQLVQYAGASGDYNPLHSDEKFAREVAGYPGIFAHGMLTMGMTGRIVTDFADPTVLVYAALSLTVIRMLPVAVALIGSGFALPSVAFVGWFGPCAQPGAPDSVSTTVTWLAAAWRTAASRAVHWYSGSPGFVG